MKRISISLLLCVALVATSVIGTGGFSFAADDQQLSSTKGVYWFDTHELGDDRTDTYIYDDELLKGDSKTYNQKLATMSFELAVASISSEREPKTEAGYANKSRNLRAYLEDNGFVDFDTNQYYKEKMSTTSMGAACAHKKIVDGGKEYTLLAIVPRSAGYEAEWGGNFVMSDEAGDRGDSAGFRNGKNIVLNFAKDYIKEYGIKGDIKVWTAGYSRGAGVTNQVGAALANRPQDYLGDSVTLAPKNLYCYTFGTPNSASAASDTADIENKKAEGAYNDSKFAYVHNTLEPYDIVTIAPPQGFGFNRYGTVTGYASDDREERMLKFLANTNPTVYDIYVNRGGDPDGFKPKTVNATASLIDGADIEIIDTDTASTYLPTNQREFMKMMEESLVEAIRKDTAEGATPRQTYANGGYQDAMKDFCGYFFANLDKGGKIVEGMEDSKYIKPLAASMYVSYMLEMYKDEIVKKSDAQLDLLRQALDALVVAAGGESGGDLPAKTPEDIKEAYNDIKTEINKKEEAAEKWTNIATYSRNLTTALFRQVLTKGLDHAKVGSDELIRGLVANTDKGKNEARAFSRILSYVLLYDTHQTSDTVISFNTVTDQVSHMATFMGNASSYMRPHNNEIILSWLRTLDDSYDNMENEKENDAQTAGYRRLYIDQPDGSDVTATVRDGSGSVVATVKNGKLISRTDSWIGVTTSDNGNWLRLPADKTYRIELTSDKTVSVDLKATEFSVYEGKEVRTVTSDKKYKWTGLSLEPGVKTTWVISAIAAPYNIASDAYYYIASSVLMAKGICKGKRSVKLSWTAVDGADRYVVYSARCKTKGKKYKIKKIKALSSAKTKWTKKYLRKNCSYKFYVVAQKKVGGKYVQIAKSRTIHLVTGNRRGRYTNPKKLTLKTNNIELAAGESYVVKGSVKKARAGKKLLTNHAARLRFSSDNPSVATVDSSGRVTAEAAGSCRIYVQTINGIWKSVQVTVR